MFKSHLKIIFRIFFRQKLYFIGSRIFPIASTSVGGCVRWQVGWRW